MIGVPDERLGEVAQGIRRAGTGSAGRGRRRSSSGRAREMANFKAPRSVEFLDALPMNATGKVVKDELRTDGARRMAQVPVAEGHLHLAERRAAADREPLHARAASSRSPRRTRARAARRPRWPSTCWPGGAGCGRGRRRTSRRRRRRTPARPGRDFVPFGVGYVELPGEVKVEARLTESDPDGARDRHGDGAGASCRSAPTTTATRS